MYKARATPQLVRRRVIKFEVQRAEADEKIMRLSLHCCNLVGDVDIGVVETYLIFSPSIFAAQTLHVRILDTILAHCQIINFTLQLQNENMKKAQSQFRELCNSRRYIYIIEMCETYKNISAGILTSLYYAC